MICFQPIALRILICQLILRFQQILELIHCSSHRSFLVFLLTKLKFEGFVTCPNRCTSILLSVAQGLKYFYSILHSFIKTKVNLQPLESFIYLIYFVSFIYHSSSIHLSIEMASILQLIFAFIVYLYRHSEFKFQFYFIHLCFNFSYYQLT